MTEERTTTIEFQGEPITVLIENDRPYVAIKPESDSKIARLRSCEILTTGHWSLITKSLLTERALS